MHLTIEAFTLAQRFRCPVIVLSDKELNLTRSTVDADSLAVEPSAQPPGPGPGLVPLGHGDVVRFTGSTHDEHQMITKAPDVVEALNRRLIAKIEGQRKELERLRADLQPKATTLLVAFGTAAGAMQAAVRAAREKGKRVSGIVVQSLWPVPERGLREAAAGVSRIVVGELNPGLYVREIRCLFPDREVVSLNRIDGQLIPPEMYLGEIL
jgi:2-oxoglutarate ferredoxin oxidoreductase subunit alpha